MSKAPTKACVAMWTIYRPDDHPGLYIVRRWVISRSGGEPIGDLDPIYIGPSLAAARQSLPPKADTYLPRSPSDEPSIVETWV
jgi:hypothetical protein